MSTSSRELADLLRADAKKLRADAKLMNDEAARIEKAIKVLHPVGRPQKSS